MNGKIVKSGGAELAYNLHLAAKKTYLEKFINKETKLFYKNSEKFLKSM